MLLNTDAGRGNGSVHVLLARNSKRASADNLSFEKRKTYQDAFLDEEHLEHGPLR